MTSNRIVVVACAILSCFISSLHAEVVSQPILAKPIVLRPGKAWTSSLIKCSSRPAILYLKGRIPADKEGKGGHALSIELNGTLLTPDNVTILNNKQKVFRLIKHGDENKDTWDIDVFDGANSSWYLIKDNDYLPEFNDDWLCQSRMFLSNYYEHLLLVPAKLLGESNRIVLRNTHGSQAIELARVAIYQPDNGVIPFARNWMKTLFTWEAPVEEDLLTGPVKAQACRGETEPFTFGIYALDDMKNVTLELTDLHDKVKSKTLSREHIDVFKLDMLDKHQAGGFLTQIKWTPKRWRGYVPSLLKPLDGSVTIEANHNQRFFMDVRVPENAAPGEYHGVIKVRSGQTRLADVPVVFKVLPFELAKPRQRYWVWRQQWNSIMREDNIGRLRDIKAHGFDGQIGNGGFSFTFRAGKRKIEVDDSEFRKVPQLMRDIGLLAEGVDANVDERLFGTALEVAGVKGIDSYHEAIGNIMQKDDAELSPAEKELKKKLPAVRSLMLPAYREIKRITDELRFKFYVMPVDEACGRFWRQEWTRFNADLLHKAGLKVWQTRNTFDWESGIDESCFGSGINDIYKTTNKGIMKGTFEGELAMPPMPYFGMFREGGDYGRRGKNVPKSYRFRGLIDEVRVYNRPLSDEEILAQHKSPAKGGLLASFDFDEKGPLVKDRSGNGHHGTLRNGATIVPGRKGSAVKFDGDDDFVDTPEVNADLSEGWTISLWMKGTGNAFGRGYDLYYDGGNLRFGVKKGKSNERIYATTNFVQSSEQSWEHYTISFDNKKKIWKARVSDADKVRFYKKAIDWVYIQHRSFPTFHARFKTGLMSWYYYPGVGNMTVFCYDWNANGLFTVYPKDGKRFTSDGSPTVWYGTMGWKSTREGIDDARYLHTLFKILKKKYQSEEIANQKIDELLSPVASASYEHIGPVVSKLGGYDAMRMRIVKEIQANRE